MKKKKLTMMILMLLVSSCSIEGITINKGSASNSNETPSVSSKPTTITIPASDFNSQYGSVTPIEKITVVYNANGGRFDDGEPVKVEEYEINSTITFPSKPKREGYSFVGWSTSRDEYVAFTSDLGNFDGRSITVYAFWTKSPFIEEFEGAEIDEESKTITLLVANDVNHLALPQMITIDDLFAFKVYKDPLMTEEIKSKTLTTDDGTLVDGDNEYTLRVYSLLASTKYTLKIHKSHAITLSYMNGETLLKTDNFFSGYDKNVDYVPEIKGYNFIEWRDSTGLKVTTINSRNDVIVYAYLSAKDYEVSLNSDGGTLVNDKVTLTYDSLGNIQVPVKEGSTFSGWYYDNERITNENGDLLTKWNIDEEDIVLTAKYDLNSYELIVNNANENMGTVLGSGTYPYETTAYLKAVPNKGYVFIGWFDSEDNKISDELDYSFVVKKDTTITAKFDYVNISINYYVDGKLVKTDSVNIDNLPNELYVYDAGEDKEFKGWYKDSDYKNKIDTISSDLLDGSNINLYGYVQVIENNELKYEIKDDTYCKVIGFGDDSIKESVDKIVIPNKKMIDGKQYIVDEIEFEAFSNCILLTNVTLPSSVTTIGIAAFYNCTSLTSITIPSGVTAIGNRAFYNCSSLTSITIPSSVTYIGHEAFYNCKSLTSITIPNGVTTIGEEAFSNCESLTSITLPNGVTTIGEEAFSNCYSLTNVYYEGTIEDWCNITFYTSFYNKNSNPMSQASHFYMLNSNNKYEEVTSIEIPDTVTSIGNYQFYGFNNVISITLPNSVTTIGDYAFYNCKSLTSITIPSGVTTIGEDVFEYCSSLTIYCEADSQPSGWSSNWNPYNRPVYYGITKDNKIEKDGIIYVIQNNEAIVTKYVGNETNVTIPSTIELNGKTYKVTTIGDKAFFYCQSLTSITIPSNVTTIEDDAFYYCKSLANIKIPSSVTTIGNGAFYNCTSLTSITIPSDVTTIGEDVFEYCSSLTIYCEATSQPSGWETNWNSGRPVYYGITKDNKIEKDGIIYVIQNNEAIVTKYVGNETNVTIPSTIELNGKTYNVVTIGKSAFEECTALTNVYYEGTIEDWCNITFGNHSSNPMFYAYHFYILNSNNEYEEVTSIEIPDAVTNIGDYQFVGFNNVTSIKFTNGVKTIGERVFINCSLLTNVYYEGTIEDWCHITFGNGTSNPMSYANHFYMFNSNSEYEEVTSIEIPETVTKIGNYQFYGFNNLKSITIPSSVTTIGNGTFYNCTSLTSITIPSSVTSIGEDAFYYCTFLTSITIPSSVTTIGESAFSYCKSLTSITIPSSVTTIGKEAFYGCSSLTIYCEAESKPSGWHSYWNYSNCTVIWGYTM